MDIHPVGIVLKMKNINSMSATRKCWRMLPKAGSIKNLKLTEEEIADPAGNEVQVEVKVID